MAFCYECGFQVAPNDIYCPNCGIALPPPVAAEPVNQTPEIHKSAPTETAPESAFSAPEIIAPAAKTESDDSETLAGDQSALPVETPAPLEIPGFPSGELQPEKSATGDISAVPPFEKFTESEKHAEDLEEVDFTGGNSGKISAPEKPPIISETAAENISPPLPKTDDAEFIMTIPYVPSVSAEEKPADAVSPFEPPIIKPGDDLSSHVSDPPPSQFDSVRIMESPPKIEHAAPVENQKFDANQINPAPPDGEEIPRTTNDGTVAAKSATSPIAGESDNKKAAKLKPLDEGTILNNRYEIIRKIGGGGMGAVYLASDNNLGGVLRAVKEMVQSYIEESQQDKAINDFKRESMILSTLEHSAIPTIYDYFYDDRESRFYLVMKYVSGGDLSAKLRSTPAGKIDEKSVTEWGIQVADVLDYLHNRPTTIVYRDLKPANLMLDGNSGRIMLIDFGIARSVSKEEKGVTAVGTMGYAPPELFSGNVEPRSDVYSLGSTMFHLLTGADPQSNPLLIFDFQKNPRPRQINSQLSDQMERILMRSVEYNADARFASAAEMRQALQEHLENLKNGKVTYGIKEAPKSVSLENQPVFCGFCGQRIMATDMFCAFCGAKQPLSQQGVHSEIYANPAISAKVMIVGTNELDSTAFDLDKDVNLVGRRDPMSNIFPEVDLSKYDPQTKISRRHALIKANGGKFTIEDLGSSNGTTVIPTAKDAHRLLPHQPHVLTDGDRIRVGDTILSFFLR